MGEIINFLKVNNPQFQVSRLYCEFPTKIDNRVDKNQYKIEYNGNTFLKLRFLKKNIMEKKT